MRVDAKSIRCQSAFGALSKACRFVRAIGKPRDGSFPKRFQKALCKSVDKNLHAPSQEAAISASRSGTWPVPRWPPPIAGAADEHDAPVDPAYGKSRTAVASVVPSSKSAGNAK